jgi:hypothetical protein
MDNFFSGNHPFLLSNVHFARPASRSRHFNDQLDLPARIKIRGHNSGINILHRYWVSSGI